MASKKQKWVRVDPKEVLVADKMKGLLFMGETLTDLELANLKQEAQTLKHFRIWRVFQETLRQEAIEQGLVNATNWEMTLSAKMMLHCLGIMASIVTVLDVYEKPVVKK